MYQSHKFIDKCIVLGFGSVLEVFDTNYLTVQLSEEMFLLSSFLALDFGSKSEV